jgi:hypothetical protein
MIVEVITKLEISTRNNRKTEIQPIEKEIDAV